MQLCAITLVLAISATAFAQVDGLAEPISSIEPNLGLEVEGPSVELADDLATRATFLYGAAIVMRLGGIAAAVGSAISFHMCTNRSPWAMECEPWLISTFVASALSMSAVALLVPAVRVDIHSNRRRHTEISFAPGGLVLSGNF